MPQQPRLSATEFAKTFHKTPAVIGYRSRCGKPTCRCATTAYRHGDYHALFWRDGSGRLCRRYVPKAEVAAVQDIITLRQAIDRAQRHLLSEARDYLRYLRQLAKEDRVW